MKNKVLIAFGGAVGYVLGTKAGRTRYAELKNVGSRFIHSPPVQRAVRSTTMTVQAKMPFLRGAGVRRPAAAPTAAPTSTAAATPASATPPRPSAPAPADTPAASAQPPTATDPGLQQPAWAPIATDELNEGNDS